VNRSLRQIKLAQTSRELAQRKYEIERVRLELGRTTNFQVLSYQRDLTNARDQEHQAVATYLKSLARLDEAVGQALQTWHVKVQTPEAPKIPSLRLDKLAVPPGLPVTD
jgi:outer membrane protein TolC